MSAAGSQAPAPRPAAGGAGRAPIGSQLTTGVPVAVGVTEGVTVAGTVTRGVAVAVAVGVGVGVGVPVGTTLAVGVSVAEGEAVGAGGPEDSTRCTDVRGTTRTPGRGRWPMTRPAGTLWLGS